MQFYCMCFIYRKEEFFPIFVIYNYKTHIIIDIFNPNVISFNKTRKKYKNTI